MSDGFYDRDLLKEYWAQFADQILSPYGSVARGARLWARLRRALAYGDWTRNGRPDNAPDTNPKALEIQLGRYRSKKADDLTVPESLNVLWQLAVVFRMMGHRWCGVPVVLFAASQFADYTTLMIGAAKLGIPFERVSALNSAVQYALVRHEVDDAPHLRSFYDLEKADFLKEIIPHKYDLSCCTETFLQDDETAALRHARIEAWKLHKLRVDARRAWRLTTKERHTFNTALKLYLLHTDHVSDEPLVQAAINGIKDPSFPLDRRRATALHAVHYQTTILLSSIGDFELLGERIREEFERDVPDARRNRSM